MAKSSRSFLLTSVVVAFPLLVLAFAQIFRVFVGPILGDFPTRSSSWPATLVIWLLAGAAALSACRLILRNGKTRN